MKKLLVLFLSVILTSFATSQAEPQLNLNKNTTQIKETYKINGQIEYNDNEIETIYLDEDIEKPQVNIPKHTLTIPVRLLNITSNNSSTRSALARTVVNHNTLSDILPLRGSITENAGGGFSYGQTWGQELSHAQMEDTTSFFLKYDAPKYFSLTTSIRQTASQDIGTQYNTLRLTPEWHITDKLTLKDSFSNYMNVPKNKNEVTLVYTPALKKYADSLKFELGVAQSYYRNGKQSSSISFSTGFKL